MEQFDQHTVEFAENWREIYTDMRQRCPVAHTDRHGGYWVVTRYDDVRGVLQDPETFASGRNLTIGDQIVSGGATIPSNAVRMGSMEMDPPETGSYRKILAPWLSRKAINAYRPRMAEIVSWAVDKVIESGSIDFVDDLSNPVPALVSLDYFGFPLDKWEFYASTLHKAAYLEKGSGRAVLSMLGDIRATVDDRRAHPGRHDDLMNAILTAEVDGEPISDDMAVELLFMLLNGGIDTSTALIAGMFHYLNTHHEERAALAADPALIPNAVDEMLRYFTPGPGIARTVMRSVEVGGCRFEPGDRVFLALGSANTDPEVFPNPNEVLLDRDNEGTHLSFGFGVHRCLGSFLAPTELAVILEEVLRRLPDYTIDESRVVHYPTIPLVNGYIAMPATFTPGPRMLSGYDPALPLKRS